MKRELNTWRDKFNRESKYKSSIIIYGNIHDLILDEKRGTYIPLINNLIDNLKSSGYENIIKWDRVDGIDHSISNQNNLRIKSQETTNSNTYDFGDDEFNTSSTNENFINQNNSSTYKEIEEFFSFLLNQIKSGSNKNAFIIDYLDYIFGSSNSLSECERNWLSILSKSLNNSNEYDLLKSDCNELGNIVILVTQKLSNIPTSYYINSPIVSTINIPIPSRHET